METLYELWGKRNPEWEERYQDSVISVFSDYGKGSINIWMQEGKYMVQDMKFLSLLFSLACIATELSHW